MTAKDPRLFFMRSTVVLMLLWSSPAWAQTFSSGSTGADGAFAPTTNIAVPLPPNGVLNFTMVNIPAGVTVTFVPNAANTAVTMLATGDVIVNGTISVNGADGVDSSSPSVAAGGPGGFAGGIGVGIGGTTPATGGQGPGGGGTGGLFVDANATYGAPASFVSLVPLFGGSGGGGARFASAFSSAGGGSGGGAIVIASSTKITLNGAITANGGGGRGGSAGCSTVSGGGSGGAIRLVAPEITGTGSLEANGGRDGFGCGGSAEAGRIRLESFTSSLSGFPGPSPSVSSEPGPVTAASMPALINLPTLTISSVGGVSAPVTPLGTYATADVSLPTGTTNPVPVTLTATNTPVGTVFTVKLIPRLSPITTVSTIPSSGTFANSTATANVNLPVGQVSVLNAFASFTLPQLASLFPLIDGEPVERVLVAANYGEPSTVTLITASGKEVPWR